MVYVEVFNRHTFKYEMRKSERIEKVKEFLENINSKEVERVVIFNPWTENVYTVVTEKYNFSFRFTLKQFTEIQPIFKELNNDKEIETKWY